jgi:sec-independent protein translocase protein TatA
MNLGFPELLVILVIVLVIFGGGKLPAIGDALGRSIRNFKKAASEDDAAPPTPGEKKA